MPLTLNEFRDAVSDDDASARIVGALGSLAKWIVPEDIRTRAADRRHRSEWKQPLTIDDNQYQPGGCHAVVVSGEGKRSLLEEAFLLPLHWQKGGTHDNRLPPGLSDTADQVASVLNAPGYSLHLMLPGQDGPSEKLLPDIAELQKPDARIPFESAFPALACGVKMLIEHKFPDYQTACTGAWQEGRGIVSVGKLPEKTEAVFSFPRGAAQRGIRNWFVPSDENANQAATRLRELSRSTDLMIRPLARRTTDVDRVLAPLLASSGIRPQPDAEFAVLQTYYQWLLEKNVAEAEDYYNRVLYEQIGQRFLSHPGSMDPRPTHFVSVVSTPALIGLAHQLFRFTKVLILHTAPERSYGPQDHHPLDYSDRAQQAEQLLNLAPDDCEVSPIVFRVELAGRALRRDVAEEMAKSIVPFLEGTNAGQVMWDTTSGLRIFSHSLEKRFARHGDWMLNLMSQWSPHSNNRIPFTESVLLWRHGEDWKI